LKKVKEAKHFAVFKKLCALANFSKMDVGDNNQEIGLSLMFTQSAYVSFFVQYPIFFSRFQSLHLSPIFGCSLGIHFVQIFNLHSLLFT